MLLKSKIPAFLFCFILTSCQTTIIQKGNTNALTKSVDSTSSITDKTWKINLLNLEKINGDSTAYFLRLNATSKQFEAKAGCNTLFGEYEIIDSRIRFSNIAATKMYCLENMKTEDALLSVLSHSNQIVIVNTTQFMLLSDDVIVAQFELVH